jgi:hypothetical protein
MNFGQEITEELLKGCQMGGWDGNQSIPANGKIIILKLQ